MLKQLHELVNLIVKMDINLAIVISVVILGLVILVIAVKL